MACFAASPRPGHAQLPQPSRQAFLTCVSRCICTHPNHHTLQVWQSLFSIRQLVVPLHEDVEGWLKFASLCRKSGRVRQAHRMLLQLLRCACGTCPTRLALPPVHPCFCVRTHA